MFDWEEKRGTVEFFTGFRAKITTGGADAAADLVRGRVED